MPLRRFGPLSAEVAVIGQGTWNIDDGDRAAAVPSLRRGLDLGLTHIDTAEMYGNGAAETIVGEAIGGRRDEVFLVSKVLPDERLAPGHDRGLRALARAARDRPPRLLPPALARAAHPLEDTIAAFEELAARGKIRPGG